MTRARFGLGVEGAAPRWTFAAEPKKISRAGQELLGKATAIHGVGWRLIGQRA